MINEEKHRTFISSISHLANTDADKLRLIWLSVEPVGGGRLGLAGLDCRAASRWVDILYASGDVESLTLGCADRVESSSLTLDEAIQLARDCAKANPPSYFVEPFEPHAWVVDAVLKAATLIPRQAAPDSPDRPLIVGGKFQSDKYPTCPPGKVPLSVEDPLAQAMLFEFARRHEAIDPEFSSDLQFALRDAGFSPPPDHGIPHIVCLIGSRRWHCQYRRAAEEEMLRGHIVLTYHSYDQDPRRLGQEWPSKIKAKLVDLCRRQIDIADEVIVVNHMGYIGPDTAAFIEYAEQRARTIRWLVPPADLCPKCHFPLAAGGHSDRLGDERSCAPSPDPEGPAAKFRLNKPDGTVTAIGVHDPSLDICGDCGSTRRAHNGAHQTCNSFVAT